MVGLLADKEQVAELKKDQAKTSRNTRGAKGAASSKEGGVNEVEGLFKVIDEDSGQSGFDSGSGGLNSLFSSGQATATCI